MKINIPGKITVNWLVILIPLMLGTYFIVIRPFGASFEFIPGDLGDARLNNYILEHFYLWIQDFSGSYWNAHFFYPNPYTIAFSENMLGSALIYVFFRFIGSDMLSAFQAWFLLGYLLNYIFAAWILSKFKFHSLSITAGAFFFTFGLPVLAQENHAQLLYRFCVPLAFYCLWNFYQTQKLDQFIRLIFWIVWQFYLCIYMGYFLSMAICVTSVLFLCISVRRGSFSDLISQWQDKVLLIWLNSSIKQRMLSVASTFILLTGIILLIWPYYHVSKLYEFARNWSLVVSFLPRPTSYFLADNSLIWSFTGNYLPHLSMRPEHQLFTGLSVIVLTCVGVIFGLYGKNNLLAWVNLWTVLVLIVMTLNISGYSLYHLFFMIPGVNGIRAVARLELIWMWPLAVFAAWAMDNLWGHFQRGSKPSGILAVVITILMFSESILYNHAVYNKLDSEVRLERLRQQIPHDLPSSPILFVARNESEPAWMLEIDAMLVAQELGFATFNGYSGYTPLDYEPAKTCKKLPRRVQKYMQTVDNQRLDLYLQLMERAVVIGFNDCKSSWWRKMP